MSSFPMNLPKISRPSQFEAQLPDDLSFQQTPSVDPSEVMGVDERANRVPSHRHNGSDAAQINLSDLIGLIEVVSAAPTLVPRNLFEQIKLYSNGGTRRLYVYVTDSAGTGAWRYTALS